MHLFPFGKFLEVLSEKEEWFQWNLVGVACRALDSLAGEK
jgi:hypothetical protein